MNKILLTLARIESLLLAQKKVFNIDDFCRYAGISRSFAYKLSASRAIPFSCPHGKLLYVKKEDVDNWLLSNPLASAKDIEQEAINFLTNMSWKGGENG